MRLINADNFEAFTYQSDNDDFDRGVQFILEKIDAASTVIEIPDNATNGDMIKAIFPCIDEKSKLFKDNGTQYAISVDIDTKWASLDFDKEWWNAPYKAEMKE